MQPWQKKKACVCQLLNMGHGHSKRHTGEQLPYKSLTFEMLWWARCPHRHSTGEQRSDSGWGAADTGDMTPPPTCLAGETPENTSRHLLPASSLLKPAAPLLPFTLKAKRRGVAPPRKTQRILPPLYVVALTHMVSFLSFICQITYPPF